MGMVRESAVFARGFPSFLFWGQILFFSVATLRGAPGSAGEEKRSQPHLFKKRVKSPLPSLPVGTFCPSTLSGTFLVDGVVLLQAASQVR